MKNKTIKGLSAMFLASALGCHLDAGLGPVEIGSDIGKNNSSETHFQLQPGVYNDCQSCEPIVAPAKAYKEEPFEIVP